MTTVNSPSELRVRCQLWNHAHANLSRRIPRNTHIPDERLAKIKLLSRWRALLALRNTPPVLIAKILSPRSLLRRSLMFAPSRRRSAAEVERRAREALTNPEDDIAWETLRAELHEDPSRG